MANRTKIKDQNSTSLSFKVKESLSSVTDRSTVTGLHVTTLLQVNILDSSLGGSSQNYNI